MSGLVWVVSSRRAPHCRGVVCVRLRASQPACSSARLKVRVQKRF